MSRSKGTSAVIGWNGDWRCGNCGRSPLKLWDQCVCGQPSPCREWVRGNCTMPKCRFPHPPFKIPEHLPKPADPIANPPAAAAKQKAVAQAHAAALAAERNPLCKEMAIVTWLGHWQCNCGKVHKLWDACKCGQQPPCREWVRGQCDLPKCRFPHPPFAIPSSLPKPDDPIANPTPEQLAIPLQTAEPTISNSSSSGGGSSSKAAVASAKPPAQAVTANGKADSGAGQPGSGGSTPVAHSSSVSSEAAGQLPNPGVYGAVGQPVPANGHAKLEAAVPPPPPPSTTKPGISFRAALLAKSAAAAAAAAAGGQQQGLAAGGEAGEAEGQPGDEQGEGEQQADPELQEQPEAPSEALEHEQQHLELQQQQFLAAAEAEQAQQAQQQQDGMQNGTLDPVVAAPASARSNQAAAAATAGALGWNPMAKGVFSPLGPSGPTGTAEALEGHANASAGGLASHMGSLQLDAGTATAAQQQQQALQQSAAHQKQQGGPSATSLQLPPPPAPVATHPPPSSLAAAGTAAGQQSQGLSGPSPRVPNMMPVGSQQPGSAHLQQPVMSPRMAALQQQQQQQQQAQGGMGPLPTSVATAMSPRRFMQQPGTGGMPGSAAAPSAMSPRYMSAAGAARSSLSMTGGAAGLKPGHLGGGPYVNGMAGQLGSGLPQQQQQQQQYTLQAALQQMALQQQQAAAAQQQQQQQQQQKPVHVVAKTLLEYGLMDPAFYHALRQVDFLPDGYYQQDTLTLEDQQRRMELFNAAVDSYIAAGVDSRSMLEISCQAKIGLTGGPLYYRCATCGQPIPTEMRQRWCPVCKVTPFCSPECHHRLFQQHRGVCNSMLTKPLLPSQIALRIAVEIYNVHGLTGAALHQAILRQTAAVQRSYAAAAAAATVAGVVDE